MWKLHLGQNRSAGLLSLPGTATVLSVSTPDSDDTGLSARLRGRLEDRLSVTRLQRAQSARVRSLDANRTAPEGDSSSSDSSRPRRTRPGSANPVNSAHPSVSDSSGTGPDSNGAEPAASDSSRSGSPSNPDSSSLNGTDSPPPDNASLSSEESSVLVPVDDINSSVDLLYLTPAPLAAESDISPSSKRVVISSDTHYTDIDASALLPRPVASASAIHLYWHVFSYQKPLQPQPECG